MISSRGRVLKLLREFAVDGAQMQRARSHRRSSALCGAQDAALYLTLGATAGATSHYGERKTWSATKGFIAL